MDLQNRVPLDHNGKKLYSSGSVLTPLRWRNYSGTNRATLLRCRSRRVLLAMMGM
jgi:hypothetical protein